ncbi:3-deoxy-D-manno-octulosonic acid transferase [Notoacmeibacter ruber]|uniref:3-deoxy-D-manno-octulosonic acid transferase n=1 Tax=Notoacmeibacter ruber TaxID=2670375 RepID=A0A3L7J9W1_9HYPH|nr:3-deoxy-D-manno-octulosonic acid transferase [Notoacmeibacter ruber]RLQ87280.1 3-deoxy-D-manno-octulosonic acid transferase [Notoacmeibacter ruber]
MKALFPRVAFMAYRTAGRMLRPFSGVYLTGRTFAGKEDRSRRRERYGHASAERPERPLVWVHAASVGELNAIAGLIDYLARHNVHVLLTTSTVTAAAIATNRFGERVTHQYRPLDIAPIMRRFLDHWRPDLAISCESEIWPVSVHLLSERHIPHALVNGRLSDRSFERWTKNSSLAAELLSRYALILAQSDEQAERFSALSERRVISTGNLKADAQIPPADMEEVRRLRAAIGERDVWAAISTHPGEEKMAGVVHKMLTKRHPDILTLVVPRHAERGDAVAKELAEAGLRVAQRSKGEAPDRQTDIWIGDTMNELGLYLRLTGIVFMGRSMADEATGGQNPLEAAMLDSAILTGPAMTNFRDAFDRLRKAGGAKTINDKEMLAGAVSFLLSRPTVRNGMAAAASDAAGKMRGALDATLRELDRYIHPLVVDATFRDESDDLQ